MRDVHITSYRDRSRGAVLRRLVACILRRMPRMERMRGKFCLRRDDDGIEYIAPTPVSAIPTGKRRAR